MYVVNPEIVDMNDFTAPAVDSEILTFQGFGQSVDTREYVSLGQHVGRRGWIDLGQLYTVDDHGNMVRVR